MLFHSMIPLLGFAPAAALATHLFVSSYDGSITSLQLSKSVRGSYSLTNLSSTLGSAPRPSWLEINPFNGLLYAVDEGWGNPNGSVAAYSRSAGGVLTQVSILPTIGSPVSTQVFNKGAALAMAHFDTSTVSNFKIKADGSLALLQTFTFALAAPGPVPDRQGVPHEHQVILDPTGKYIITPDLGADLVRVFTIDPVTNLLATSTPFAVPAGSGPRHAKFLVSGGSTYLFLISELANSIASYKVTYGARSLSFTQISLLSVYGTLPVPAAAGAGELNVSPCGAYLLTSNRHDQLFRTKNGGLSDSISTFAINGATGALTFKSIAASGGEVPRGFNINSDGTLVAIANQGNGTVVIAARNVDTGAVGPVVASFEGLGNPGPNQVIWE